MPIIYETSVNLAAEFMILQWAEDLLGEFVILQGAENLLGEFVSGGPLDSEALSAEFVSRNATTVGATAATGNDPILDPYQKSPFYAARRRWGFYSNGVNLAFRSSTDGVTWSAETLVRPCTSGDQFSIKFDGTYVHYAYISGLQGQGHGVFYCRGEPQTNGTITWSQVEQRAIQVGEPTIETFSRPSVSVDSEGYPWIAYHYLYDEGGDAHHYVYAVKSQQNDGSFTGAPFPVRIDYVGEFETTARIIILPLKGRKMYCLWDKEDDILGRLHTGPDYDDWDSEEDTGADIAAPGLFDAVSFVDNIHLAWTEKTTLKLQHRQRVYGVGWSASHEIYDAVLADMGPSISRGSQGKDPKLYVFWAPDEANPTADHVFYSISTDDGINWAAQVDWIDDSADGFPLPNQQSAFEAQGEFYIGCVWVRSSPDDIRYYELEEDYANGLEELSAEFEVGQGWENLASEFEAGQNSAELLGTFNGQDKEELPGEFEVGQGWQNLPGEFIVRHDDLEELSGEFVARQDGLTELLGTFEGQDKEELLGIFDGQDKEELFTEFIVRHTDFAANELDAQFITRHSDLVNLLAEFIPRRSASTELLDEFISRHSDLVELPGEFIARHADSAEFVGEFIVRHSDLEELLTEFIVQHAAFSSEPLGIFIIRHADSADLPAEFIVQHATSLPLSARFASRALYPYWTSRALVNGVIAAAEALIGDAPFEFVMEGVMDDIKVWSDANEVAYATWTDLDSAPTAIKRATTYGVVAALYARHTQTFQGKVIPTLAPVTVTVVGDDEKAMQHWMSKMDDMLELYLSAQGADRLWVSTADEEPVFSMDDIPGTGDDRELTSWHDWV